MELIGASIDCETTGLVAGVHEIIEFTVLLHSKDFKPLDRFTSTIQPMHPEVAQQEAMDVNGFTLKELASAPTPTQVRSIFYQWCDEVVMDRKIIPLGHNYTFDKGFLQKFLGVHYESYFHYKNRDTQTVSQYLRDSNKLDIKSTGLVSLAKHFSIAHKAHTSYGDAKATLQLYRRLLSI